ncbi:YciI family protein [Piscirickettsia litoralis]|uniref:YCII-related domain-containing protein n=1 Tax=Piscirickettsia litoralis TaxID=1891921 RepID=A0ABX3A0D0_9GAMM|nr:hypothetical protein [Piscirickettsia litoralis]ODN42312.1 hypothetical protein BGC07_04405 [Piscirickettsia litoralis]
MLLIKLDYKVDLAHLDQHKAAHRIIIENYMNDSLVLLAGPLEPRTGGMILFTDTKEQAWQMIEQDPFYTHHLAEYAVIEWRCYDKNQLEISST